MREVDLRPNPRTKLEERLSPAGEVHNRLPQVHQVGETFAPKVMDIGSEPLQNTWADQIQSRQAGDDHLTELDALISYLGFHPLDDSPVVNGWGKLVRQLIIPITAYERNLQYNGTISFFV